MSGEIEAAVGLFGIVLMAMGIGSVLGVPGALFMTGLAMFILALGSAGLKKDKPK